MQAIMRKFWRVTLVSYSSSGRVFLASSIVLQSLSIVSPHLPNHWMSIKWRHTKNKNLMSKNCTEKNFDCKSPQKFSKLQKVVSTKVFSAELRNVYLIQLITLSQKYKMANLVVRTQILSVEHWTIKIRDRRTYLPAQLGNEYTEWRMWQWKKKMMRRWTFQSVSS